MELTPVYWIYWILFLDSCGFTACQSPGSLIVRPNRHPFFEYESVSLSCEVQGNSTGWIVVKNPANLTQCGDVWGNLEGINCHISSTKSVNSGVYWCQSESGELSNTVNITVTDAPVILEIPILPVTEGHSVTLSCRHKETPSDLTADFYKDGSFIKTESTGEMTIPAVSQSAEGWYWCQHSKGNSPKSWVTVTASTSSTQSSSNPSLAPSSSKPPLSSTPPSSTPSPLLLPLSLSGVAGLIISLTILLLLFCYRKRTKEEATSDPREVTYADVRIKQDQEHRKRAKAPGADPVYSAVKTSTNTGGASAGPRDVTYGQLEIRTKKKKREKPLPLEPDVVYSSVRPAVGPSKGGRV